MTLSIGMTLSPKTVAQFVPKSIDEAAYEFLRDRIVLGELKPGTELQLAPLASSLGVSTMPVRNAIARLTAEGLVNSSPRKRAYVAALDFNEFQEYSDLRCAIESLAAAVGIDYLSPSDIERMQELHDRFLQSAEEFDEYMSPEWDAYFLCFAASKRPKMIKTIIEFRRATERYIRLTLGNVRPKRVVAAACLQRLIDAARQRDPSAARDALADAHKFLQAEVLAALESQGIITRGDSG